MVRFCSVPIYYFVNNNKNRASELNIRIRLINSLLVIDRTSQDTMILMLNYSG